MKTYDFVIIGAGLSGLAAHHALLKKGYAVLTLEASAIPGGRVRTEELDGAFCDTGAQFLTFNYPRACRLLKELGLTPRKSSSKMAQLQEHRKHVIQTKNPFGSWASGLLSFSSWVRLVGHTGKLKLTHPGVHPEDPAALARFDETDARSYALEHLNDEILEKILTPYFSAFNYAAPEELSGAMVVRALLHFASGKSLLGLSGGLATFPLALAEKKEIRYSTPVLSITRGAVTTATEKIQTKKIIIATGAHVAQKLLGDDFPHGISTRANPSAHEAVLTRAKNPEGIYGTLVSAARNPFINVLTDESMKAPGLVPQGKSLYGVLLSRQGAREKRSDGALELLGIDPGEIVQRRSTHWERAIPLIGPGQLRGIQSYRRGLTVEGDVFLAGDYLSTGCVEGAVESGEFVASLFPHINALK